MTDYSRPHMLPKLRSKAIMSAGNGMPCTARVASFANLQCSGRDTVVAHHPTVFGKGMATKETDLSVMFVCSVCHALLEGKNNLLAIQSSAVMERVFKAQNETLAILLGEGIIVVPDGKIIW